MDPSRLLEGKVAVVSGGGVGIGGAVSRLFAQHGARVEIAEVDPARGQSAVADIERAGGRARTHDVDVREASQVDAFKQAVLDEHGRCDVVVNNVGDYIEIQPFRHSTPEHWDDLYRMNFHHALLMTRAFVETMVEQESGSIVNISSVEGMRGYPPDPIYGAFKAALNHFTTSLAVELGRKGVRVNCIGPDLCQTPQVDYHAGTEGKEHLWEVWAPVGRVGSPEEQAQVVLFLASDQSSFVTGHTIPTDGGTLAGGGWFWSPERRRWVNRPFNP